MTRFTFLEKFKLTKRARKLRKKGWSIWKIAIKLGVAGTTIKAWAKEGGWYISLMNDPDKRKKAKYLRLKKGYNTRETAAKLGVHVETIRNWAKKDGWFKSRQYTKEERKILNKRALKLHKNGYGYKKIAEKLGLKDNTFIMRLAKQHGWYEPRKLHGQNLLDRSEEARILYEEKGWTYWRIAEKFNVSSPTVLNWATKGGWRTKCYIPSRRDLLDRLKDQGITEDEYLGYKIKVRNWSDISYRKHRDKIDPDDKRSRKWHLDHRFSIYQGGIQGIPVKVVAHPANLRIMRGTTNQVKNRDCHISLEELRRRIKKWEKKHGKMVWTAARQK